MASDDELRIRDRLGKLGNLPLLRGVAVSGELKRLQKQLKRLEQEPAPAGDDIWLSVELARHQERPYTLDYVERLMDDWTELHGDRALVLQLLQAVIGGHAGLPAEKCLMLGAPAQVVTGVLKPSSILMPLGSCTTSWNIPNCG